MNTTRFIRPAAFADIEVILSMCDHSRSLMRASGNTTQWTNGYPGHEAIEQDILGGHGHIIEENGKPIGYFALVHGADPTYSVIEGGLWLDDYTPYATVHRLSCAPGHKGIGRTCFEWSSQQAASLRSDTHEDNTIMQHILLSLGFTYCGIIHIADGTPRLAYQLMTYPMVDSSLKSYVEQDILPRHHQFDAAHQIDHIRKVMAQSMELAAHYPQLDKNMVYTIAAYHDTGIVEGRETHHIVSGRIMREDKELPRWFTPEQIETMAQAVEDHRASSHSIPRSLYGKVVAEADRNIDPLTIIRRTIQYGLSHYPQLEIEGHWNRTLQHLEEKYSPSGYLKLYIPESRNQLQQQKLWNIMNDKKVLRAIFEKIMADERK